MTEYTINLDKLTGLELKAILGWERKQVGWTPGPFDIGTYPDEIFNARLRSKIGIVRVAKAGELVPQALETLDPTIKVDEATYTILVQLFPQLATEPD